MFDPHAARLEELGVQPAKTILTALGVPSWPILEGDAWNESQFDWQNMSLQFMDMGLYDYYVFAYSVGIDISNTSRHTLKVIAEYLVQRGCNSAPVPLPSGPPSSAFFNVL